MTKRILAVALAVMMLLIVAFPASAAVQTNKLMVRGSVFNQSDSAIPSWNAQTFPGFYYDLKYDRETEKLNFTQNLSGYAGNRSIAKNGLIYNTTKTPVDFKAYEKQLVNVSGANVHSYQLVGWQAEKWIAIKDKANKIARLAFEMGKEDKKTLTTGETWSLGSGYELTINAIDARTNPRQVWFTLKKDGAIVDEGIGQAPASTSVADKEKAVYYKTKTIMGESDALLFTVYVDTIFSGATSDMVQFRYAWLIDEGTAKEIKSADKFGVFEVRAANADYILLDNENSVSLSSNTETTLMGNIKFLIADDSNVLRLYPFVEYTAPGNYELRGKVFNQTPDAIPSWNAQTFPGFYYDLKYNRETEKLNFTQNLSSYAGNRSIAKNGLIYNTTKTPVDFKAYEKQLVNVSGANVHSYQLVGWQAEKWIAIKDKANKIARLAFEMGKEDKKTLTTGETWSLGAGYELTINAIDARTNPRQVWFTLKKDGAIVDEGIGQAPASTSVADKEKAVYYKTKTIMGESDALLFTVYVDTIFSGATSDMVQFRYAWLIDESSAKEIKSADKFGVFEVRAANADYILLDNENSVSLSSNTETTLMGEIKFRIADDSNVLRLYPKVDYVIGGEPTNETTVTSTVTTTVAKPKVNATTNATTAPTVAKPVATETPVTTEAKTPAPTTQKEPGFEAVFAIAGLLAVAFLVLRQRK